MNQLCTLPINVWCKRDFHTNPPSPPKMKSKEKTNLKIRILSTSERKDEEHRGTTISLYILFLLFYLPCRSTVIDTVPMELFWYFSLDSISRPRSIRVGGPGLGRLELSLLNIRMTKGMSGRSSARSCTHRSAMWMHLRTCRTEQDTLINGSISSSALSSFHCLHA